MPRPLAHSSKLRARSRQCLRGHGLFSQKRRFTHVFLGNSVVILAFIVDRRLRTRSNFFLLNLSICDFLVGAASISMYIPYKFTGKWILGKFLCKLWITIDFTITTASAYSVVLISYDRFLSVNEAVVHRSLQNRHRRTAFNMSLVWILAFLVYGPAVLLWDIITGTSHLQGDKCYAAFLEIWFFTLGASTLDFMLPLLSISFFNLRIYLEIIKRSSKRLNSSIPSSLPFSITDNTVFSSPQTNEKGQSISIPCAEIRITSTSPQNSEGCNVHISSDKLSQDKKAAKSLAILVSVFFLCWTPYSFLASIRAACRGYCADYFYIEVTLWFIYTNSAINPILYPVCHKSFRQAFKLLLERFIKFFLKEQ
ncbi:histamine H3 receptor [Xenopus laevis]|uniref:Histamine H3 receptor n=1 Tax=Xenopus laevis TaxID=8355 RepID=A0A8J1KZ91_XENLA|nr:histamine H3 receptor [Xenopus laevis]